ncbi:MAG: tyrosine-protein phosphatase [Chitinophagales bacterium]
MAALFKKLFANKKILDFSILHADMHAHLIPGIDDGSTSVDSSINMIRGMQALGFKKFITTPHVMPDVFNNSAQNINAGCKQLNAVIKNEVGTEVVAAAEYYVDGSFVERIKGGEKFLTFGDNYILVEVSMMAREKKMEEVLFELNLKGYKPVLAHVERYPYLFDHHKLDQYEQLRDADVLLQVNLRSFVGNYGEIQKKIARKLAENKMIDFLGTDIHNENQLPALKDAMHDHHVQQLLEDGNLVNSTL